MKDVTQIDAAADQRDRARWPRCSPRGKPRALEPGTSTASFPSHGRQRASSRCCSCSYSARLLPEEGKYLHERDPAGQDPKIGEEGLRRQRDDRRATSATPCSARRPSARTGARRAASSVTWVDKRRGEDPREGDRDSVNQPGRRSPTPASPKNEPRTRAATKTIDQMIKLDAAAVCSCDFSGTSARLHNILAAENHLHTDPSGCLVPT